MEVEAAALEDECAYAVLGGCVSFGRAMMGLMVVLELWTLCGGLGEALLAILALLAE